MSWFFGDEVGEKVVDGVLFCWAEAKVFFFFGFYVGHPVVFAGWNGWVDVDCDDRKVLPASVVVCLAFRVSLVSAV